MLIWRAILGFLVLLVCGVSSFSEDTGWIELKTEHFVMFTTNNAQEASLALRVFEQAYSFFHQQTLIPQTAELAPVTIIAFRSEQEYAHYRLNEGAFAYYLRNYRRDYIVMQDIAPEHFGAVIHEYTHLVVSHTGWKLPLWLNEGLAELYSSLDANGDQATVGRFLPSRCADLERAGWLGLETLFTMRAPFSEGAPSEHIRTFYAESWLLCHMLYLSPVYKEKFGAFLQAVSSGRSSADALEDVYGKAPNRVQADLIAYLGNKSHETASIRLGDSATTSIPQAVPLDSFARDIALCDFLAARPHLVSEARARLITLAQVEPSRPEPEESLGYMAWQTGDQAAARTHFGRALVNGSQNAKMLYQYASLLEADPETRVAEAGSARAALLKVLTLRPDYADARLQFALLEFRQGNYEAASTNLQQIEGVSPEQAYSYYSVLAYSEYHLGKLGEARRAAVRAKEYASSPERQGQCARLLARLP